MEIGSLVAHQTRDGRIELRWTGHVVLWDGAARTLHGDPNAATYWRSSAKLVQAVAVLRTRAWDAFGLPEEALALACGSHAGEARHVVVAQAVLDTIGLGPDALLCGTHPPWGAHAAKADPRTTVHNNCSGKHAAMLAACRQKSWPVEAYLASDHPLQRAVHDLVKESAGLDVVVPWGVDGCGVPTWWTRLDALARAFSWLNDDADGRRVLDAIAAHPVMVSGTDQFCTDLARQTKGRVIGKYGALGVYAAVHRPTGAALAIKLDAGPEEPTKAVALQAMLDAGWIDAEAARVLERHRVRSVRNHAGVEVGRMEPVCR